MFNSGGTSWSKKLSLALGFFTLVILSLLLVAFEPGPDIDPQSTPEATLVPYQDELLEGGFVELVPNEFLPPVMPENPVQADYGEEPYFLICMACHGDWGQGLTEEWRLRGFGDESANCWQSQCHGSNHPPIGFVLPKSIPSILGYGSLARFSNAYELYKFIYETMPWWDPGSLSEEQAWGMTAYFMRARGEIDPGTSLTAGNAPIYRLHSPAPKVVDEKPGVAALLVTLTTGLLAFIWKVN
jgi:cytochrome c